MMNFPFKCKKIVILLVLFIFLNGSTSEEWKNVRCDITDHVEPVAQGGVVPPHHFPWLGIIQHAFYIAEKTQYAVTSGVLIHPGFVLAPAQDISRIQQEQFSNNTKFIIWNVDGKVVLEVFDYFLHPEFVEKITSASLALVRLNNWATGRRAAPIDPICMPLRGMGTFDNIYVVKMNDDKPELQKEIHPVYYVDNKQCEEFYFRAELSLQNMSPTYPLCAVVKTQTEACLWDAGTLLITRMNLGHWTLLGFGMRGPGCGAPARFVTAFRALEWIDDVITTRRSIQAPPEYKRFYLRQSEPYRLALYPMDYKDEQINTEFGQCSTRAMRGHIEYAEQIEVGTALNFALGFFYAEVTTIAQVTCANVYMEGSARSNLAVWLEHHCHDEVAGLAAGQTRGPETRRMGCFVYFRSTAYMEFRFMFSFNAFVLITLFSLPHPKYPKLDPWPKADVTEAWLPTPPNKIAWDVFYPSNWSPFI